MRVRRWTVRARLAVLIAVVVTTAGAAVLAAQYLVVAHLLGEQARHAALGSAPGASAPAVPGEGDVGPGVGPGRGPGVGSDEVCVAVGGDAACGRPGPVEVSGVVVGVRDAVLGQALWWSVGIVVLLATVAGVVAWWLAGRSLGRLRAVTRLARATSERDLHARLDLPGPHDEVKELGDTIDAMLARLEQAFEDRERFVADASHELRTPIAANRAALEAPLAQGRFPADVVPDVRRALAANARSAALVAALLQLARGELDPAAAHDVDLTGTVEAVLDGYADRVRARGLDVTTDLVGATVRGDETLLVRAVDNVLDNATRYTPAGGAVHVAVDAGRCVRLVVDNDGPVLTAAQASRLVEPFHRGPHRTADAEGHGLGLAIVRSVVGRHGGRVEVTPRAGGGLRTSLTMQRAGGDGAAAVACGSVESSRGSPPRTDDVEKHR